jgi:hypothetical protein
MAEKSLYKMTSEFQILTEMLEDETAPQDEIGKALIALQSDIVTKAENGMAYMAKLEEVIAGAKAEKKRIDAFIKAMESRKKRIEGAYIYALKTLGTDAILTNKGEMKVRKNPPSVVIDDVAKIPTEFQKQKIDVTIDKVALKKAIQNGEKVDGAHIEQNEKLVY